MYTGIFRTCREKHNLIKILTFNKINNIILAFYDELLKHPFGCFCFGKIKLQRKNVLFYVIARSYMGVPAGYCVPVGKRNKQAKDKQLSLATIVWSKVQFMTCNVPKAHIAPKVHRFCQQAKTSFHRFLDAPVRVLLFWENHI